MASVAPLIRSLALQMGLDPAAVLAVARGEGGLVNRPGTQDIGDLAGGGSYGPFQLYAQGALPRQYRGNRQLADSWAWSPQGIKYALSRMVGVGAKGLKGEEAVRRIIEQFERPADPASSIKNAIARLADYGSGAMGQTPDIPMSVGREGVLQKNDILQSLIQGDDTFDILIRQLQGGGAARPNPVAGKVSAPPGVGPDRIVADTELFYDPLGAFKHGKAIAPIGGHSDHLHAAFSNRWSAIRAIKLAQSLGLRVGENPFVDPVERVHTPTSWHYQNFAKPYMGKPVGRAIDVSGNAEALSKLFRYLRPPNG